MAAIGPIGGDYPNHQIDEASLGYVVFAFSCRATADANSFIE
jgi:hypothetical protein